MPSNPTTLDEVLFELRQHARNESEKGRLFEVLMRDALPLIPIERGRIDQVWRWKDWPHSEGADAGIDLVAQLTPEAGGGLIAVQCKFYQDGKSRIAREDIDSFITASGRSYDGKRFTERLLIVTTSGDWTEQSEAALKNQHPPCRRWDLEKLRDFPIDWGDLQTGRPKYVGKPRDLRDYQREAVKEVCNAFKKGAERGQMIMACGTGKTLTALRIAETYTKGKGHILVLMPSLSLLSQTMNDWAVDGKTSHRYLAVCSDTQVGYSRENEDIMLEDLALLPTTDADTAARWLAESPSDCLNVVFSTYQSLDAVQKAQSKAGTVFDLVLADEAHRTAGTGHLVDGKQKQALFTRIHKNDIVQAHRRLYMTATPKVYGSAVKSKAADVEVEVYSMDDKDVFGEVLYKYSFSRAVADGYLADYHVVIFSLYESDLQDILKQPLSDPELGIRLPDAVKLVGCAKAIAKPPPPRITKHGNNGSSQENSANADKKQPDADHVTSPLRRIVAFCGSIESSKIIQRAFPSIVQAAEETLPEGSVVPEVQHVDGTMNAKVRNKHLRWLREETSDSDVNSCRILTNARCLTEGIDVPALDGVIFFSPRKSQIDIVQAVGRVMRKAPGKETGYVILPVVAPDGAEPKDFLDKSETYRHVWQVLAALRAHDDTFEAMINQVEFNHKLPDKMTLVPPGSGDAEGFSDTEQRKKAEQLALRFQLKDWQDAVIPRLVSHCGSRIYWRRWAGEVGTIAQRIAARIEGFLADKDSDDFKRTFDRFLKSLRNTLNPSVTDEQAIDLLAQHWITRPVFDALFESYTFSQRNSVSRNIERVFKKMKEGGLQAELQTLDSFYKDVAERARGIDTLSGRQNLMEHLYGDFFKIGFKKDTERLGIVYTPVEVVDFVLRSADDALREHFGRSLSDEKVHILDPFTGTGRFLVRLLGETKLVDNADLERKYCSELYMNEIMLLPYYIAGVNVEQVYHSLRGGDYETFQGGVLCDTFQMQETGHQMDLSGALPANAKRAERQNKMPITVIVSNPPYSAGQRSENDANRNLKYSELDESISGTYAAWSSAANKNSLYDSYIRAIRWACDRVEEGVTAYVTNGSFINSNATDGLRQCLLNECSAVYVLNLRGNARTSGEIRRREGGSIFGEGTRTSVAILVLVKKRNIRGPGRLYYADIGDNLTRKEKLKWLKSHRSLHGVDWQNIEPSPEGDWVQQRDPSFVKFLPMGSDTLKQATIKNAKQGRQESMMVRENSAEENLPFYIFTSGVKTNRDFWVWNDSIESLSSNMRRLINFYNVEMQRWKQIGEQTGKEIMQKIDAFVNNDPSKISWSRSLKNNLRQGQRAIFKKGDVREGMYRPFCRRQIYYDPFWNEETYQTQLIWPDSNVHNPAICVLGRGSSHVFSVWMTDVLPDLSVMDKSQCFPLYYYDVEGHRCDNIGIGALEYYRNGLNLPDLTRKDLFCYVYAVLHHPEYRKRYAGNLMRELPRIPCLHQAKAYIKAGRKLMRLHINYEDAKPYPLQMIKDGEPLLSLDGFTAEALKVRKMRFGGKQGNQDKSVIHYNEIITLEDIPEDCYRYVVNGKSLVEWVMERFRVTTDQQSGIENNPNKADGRDPDYIITLLKKAVTVGMESAKISESLPEWKLTSGY